MASEEMNFPLVLRQARKAVSDQNYGEAAVLYTSVMAHKDMANNFDIKVRHAFCVEKTGHINQAIKLYEGIIKLYLEAGEEGAAKGVEQTIAELKNKVKEEAAAEKAKAEKEAAEKARVAQAEVERLRAEKVAAEKAKAEKVRIAQAEIEKLRADKAAAEKAKAEKAKAAKAEIENLRVEKIREEHAAAEKARLEQVLIKKKKAEKERAERSNTGRITVSDFTSTVEMEAFDSEDSEGEKSSEKTFDGTDTTQLHV